MAHHFHQCFLYQLLGHFKSIHTKGRGIKLHLLRELKKKIMLLFSCAGSSWGKVDLVPWPGIEMGPYVLGGES